MKTEAATMRYDLLRVILKLKCNFMIPVDFAVHLLFIRNAVCVLLSGNGPVASTMSKTALILICDPHKFYIY